MKKAITCVAVAIAAIASQAATMTWSSGTILLPKGGTDGAFGSTKAGSGVVQAYYFIVDASAYGSFDADKAFSDRFETNDSTGAISLKSGVTASYTRGSTGGGAANWASQTINEGQSIYAFAVYTYTDASKQGWYIANKAYAALAAGDAAPTGAYTNLASSVGSWTAVPEPTSVALLALGLAAVGLKRKVA